MGSNSPGLRQSVYSNFPNPDWLEWSTQHQYWYSYLLIVGLSTVSLLKNMNGGSRDSLVATSSHPIITKGLLPSNEVDTVNSKSRETGSKASSNHWIKLLQSLSYFWTFH